MREFTTAARAQEEDAAVGEPVTITLDGEEITFAPADETQIALVMAGGSETQSLSESVAVILNFFFELIEDPDQHRLIKRRLWNKKDPFGMEQISEIVNHLIEEWAARPTKQPSDYMPSQRTAGARSTARRRHTA